MEMNKKRHYIVDKATSTNTVNHNIQVINLGRINGKQKPKENQARENIQREDSEQQASKSVCQSSC